MSASEDEQLTILEQDDMDISVSSTSGTISEEQQQKAESLQERNKRLKEEMQTAFTVLTDLGKHNPLYNQHFKRDRVVVDVPSLLDTFNNGCQNLSCDGKSKVINSKMEAGVLSIPWECSKGHIGQWTSSKVLCQKKGESVFTNALLFAAGIFVSGNSYDKVSLFCHFLGLGHISKATYNRMQIHFIIPEVIRYWEQMKNEIWEIITDEPVILCGDGRNDSPGFSAMYGMYALMEQHLDIIIDLEIVDKRQTGRISTNMEVLGLKKIMERLVGQIIVSEIMTDASTAVIALVKKMKGNRS